MMVFIKFSLFLDHSMIRNFPVYLSLGLLRICIEVNIHPTFVFLFSLVNWHELLLLS